MHDRKCPRTIFYLTIMITFPNAKINLGLNIVAKRHDGYHDIETVFYPIGIHDILEIVPSDSGKTTLYTYGNPIDCEPEKNLVMKAYRLMRQHADLPEVDIHLYKHIPDGAGLGGGSSDASFTIKALNELGGNKLNENNLADIASQIGADCAFFIYDKPMYATGIGNEFTPTTVNLSGLYLLLIKPPVAVSTAEAYSRVTPHPSKLSITEILKQPIGTWKESLKNDFEPSIYAIYPQLSDIKQQLYDLGASYASMSGSGSSIFGIFENAILAENASKKINGCLNFVMKL